MAYQKELWTSDESTKREIGEILSCADFLDYEDERDLESQRVRVQFEIIPDLIDQFIEGEVDNYDKYKFDYIGGLITYDQIGVELAKEKLATKVQLVTYEVDDQSVSLVILVDPSVRSGLESLNERNDLVNKFKGVLLLALDKYQRMSDEGVFVPYSKV